MSMNQIRDAESDGAPTQRLLSSRAMCYCCFDALIDALQQPNRSSNSRSRIKTKSDFANALPDPSVQCPLFVTWEKCTGDGTHWELRGCIGCLSPRPLATYVADYALMSAFRDRRFNSITLEEVHSLRVCVSLLVEYEDCRHVYDWTIGVHGIMIKFVVNGQRFHGTFLPEVAKQQRWDHEHTLSSLIRKAGYKGIISQELLNVIHCTRYQSSKCQATFGDYVELKCEGIDPVCDLLGNKVTRTRPWSTCKNM